jgi:hypothetical protein
MTQGGSTTEAGGRSAEPVLNIHPRTGHAHAHARTRAVFQGCSLPPLSDCRSGKTADIEGLNPQPSG